MEKDQAKKGCEHQAEYFKFSVRVYRTFVSCVTFRVDLLQLFGDQAEATRLKNWSREGK